MLSKWVRWGFVCFFLCFLAKWDMLKEYRVSICVLKENFQKVACRTGYQHGRKDSGLQVYFKVSLLLAAIFGCCFCFYLYYFSKLVLLWIGVREQAHHKTKSLSKLAH